jgi:CheY-like chemotaxis protein
MSKRILVVDDQEDLRGELRDLLIGSGHTVIEAADGETGVAKPNPTAPTSRREAEQVLRIDPNFRLRAERTHLAHWPSRQSGQSKLVPLLQTGRTCLHSRGRIDPCSLVDCAIAAGAA